jgi:hypothetical protein
MLGGSLGFLEFKHDCNYMTLIYKVIKNDKY